MSGVPSPSMVVMLVALVHHRERQAGVDPPAVDDHRAGAALAVVAALLGAGEMQMLAQRVEQRGARVELELPGLAIHLKGYVGYDRNSDSCCLRPSYRRRRGVRSRGYGERRGAHDEQVTPGQSEIVFQIFF